MSKILLSLGIMFVIFGINSVNAQQTSFDDMDHSQFLDFCSSSDYKSWETMSADERQVSMLCDPQSEGFGQKQLIWLNGANLDWCQNSPKHVKTSNQFWDVIPVRLVSDTDEFQLLHEIKESFVINSDFVEHSCQPNVWMSGTFASKDDKKYGFALEYDSDHFRYWIDKTKMEDGKAIPTPRQQMKMGVPLYEIKCKEGLYPTFKIDRITPACVTESTLDKLLIRGWSPLRLGMPAETNILITYGAIQVFPHNVTQKLDPDSPYSNMIFWVNNDIIPHTIVAKDGTWSTGMIGSGKIGSVIFNQTGVYDYFIKEKPSTIGFVEFSGMVEIED